MKWFAKLGKIKPVPLASSAASVLLSGYFATQAMGYLNATPLEAVDDRPSQQQAPTALPTPRLSTEEISQGVLERNIFDSTVGSIAWEDRPATTDQGYELGEEGPETEITEAPLTDCKSDLRLLAVFMAEDTERHFAVIRAPTRTMQMPVGMEVEGLKLLLLAATHAYVRMGSSPPCRLPLYLSTTPPPPPVVAAPAPAEPPKRPSKPGLFTDADHAAGITEIGPDSYKVARSMVTRGMADAAGVVRGTKFFPQAGEGGERNQGVKLKGVTEGSTLSKLGMKEGDVLRTLNGVNLSTPDGMLSAYALLREQKKVSLSVLRDGRPKTISYQFE